MGRPLRKLNIKRQSVRKLRRLHQLRRAAAQQQPPAAEQVTEQVAAGDDAGSDVIDGADASSADHCNTDETVVDEDAGETEGDQTGDTKKQLLIAVDCLKNAGIEAFLKSAVGGKMNGEALKTCLSRTVSVAQYVYEKVPSMLLLL
jgi:hypothetical protein